MRTRSEAEILSDLAIAANFPIGTRVRSGRNAGVIIWRPFVCDAGTVEILVRWDGFHPDRDTTYARVSDLSRE